MQIGIFDTVNTRFVLFLGIVTLLNIAVKHYVIEHSVLSTFNMAEYIIFNNVIFIFFYIGYEIIFLLIFIEPSSL